MSFSDYAFHVFMLLKMLFDEEIKENGGAWLTFLSWKNWNLPYAKKAECVGTTELMITKVLQALVM